MAIKRKRHVKRKKSVISSHRRAALLKKAKKIAFSMKAPLRTYVNIERKIDKTWKKLRTDVKNRSLKAIKKGRRDLLLLLGECNYMAKECARCLTKKSR